MRKTRPTARESRNATAALAARLETTPAAIRRARYLLNAGRPADIRREGLQRIAEILADRSKAA